jgi:integrase
MMAVYERGEGWYFRVDAGRDERGRRLRVNGGPFPSERTAERAGDRRRVEVADGGAVRNEKLTFGDYIDGRFFPDYVELRCRPATIKRYRSLLDADAMPVLGRLPLKKIRPTDVERLLANARRRGLSERTCLHLFRVVFAALKRGVRWGLLTVNPAEAVDRPKAGRFLPPVLSLGELLLLCEASDAERIGAIVRVALWTGLRRGELFRLTWPDVDFDSATLMVRESKSRAGIRAVALTDEIVRVLREHRRTQLEARVLAGAAWAEGERVFTNALGEPLSGHTLRHSFGRALDSAGVRCRFHDLRHAHGTILILKAGVPLKAVSARLGHADISTTADIYAHVMADDDRAAVAGFDAFLAPNRSQANGHEMATNDQAAQQLTGV